MRTRMWWLSVTLLSILMLPWGCRSEPGAEVVHRHVVNIIVENEIQALRAAGAEAGPESFSYTVDASGAESASGPISVRIVRHWECTGGEVSEKNVEPLPGGCEDRRPMARYNVVAVYPASPGVADSVSAQIILGVLDRAGGVWIPAGRDSAVPH